MSHPLPSSRLTLLLLAASLLAGPARSQDKADPEPAPAAAVPASPDVRPPADDPPKEVQPSAATLKSARLAGMHPETRNGRTMFCWEDANIGTRFKTKKCVDETRLAEVLEQRQLLQEQMHRMGCGGAQCGGAK